MNSSVDQKYNKLIIFISILIPVVVAILFRIKLSDLGYDAEPLTFLPPIYATINGITAIVLVGAVLAIKKGNRNLHEKLMVFAIILSLTFLVMYVAYHMTSKTVYFGDLDHNEVVDSAEKAAVGSLRYFYYFILISHIFFSVIIIPLVLFTYVRALAAKFDKHKKLAKITFPIWLYVAVTGVIVYLMIAPYYYA